MTTSQSLLAACVALPLAGSLLLPIAGRVSAALRGALALGLVLAALGCAAALLPGVLAGGTADVAVHGVALLHADRLAVFMALVSAGLGVVIVVYGFGYLRGLPHRGEYDLLVVLFLGAMMALVFARHLLVLYAAWELTAVACWRLIGFFRRDGHVARADKAFLVTAFGAVVMLLGFLSVYAAHGTFDLGRLQGAHLSAGAAALVLAGLFSKSATLPLHGWLPDAGVAPSPVTALLHAAVLVKIGVYVYARLFGATFAVDPVVGQVVPWIAAASALVAGLAALLEHDLKRLIAYSTVSQLGFIFLGLAVGGPEAAPGALLFILVHALGKGGLFLCAGVVEHAAHTKDLRRLGGLAGRLPVTAASFALCACSVMGLPPFGGYFAKHLVLSGTLGAGRIPLALVFFAGSALTILYLVRAFDRVFLGAPGPAVAGHEVHEGTPLMVGCVALLAALSLAAGLGVRWPLALAGAAAQELAGVGAVVAPPLAFAFGPVEVGIAFLVAAAVGVAVAGAAAWSKVAVAALVLAAGALVAAIGAGDVETLTLCWGAAAAPIAVALLRGAGGDRLAPTVLVRWALGDLAVLAGLGLVEGATPALGAGLVALGAAVRLGGPWRGRAAWPLLAGRLAAVHLGLRLSHLAPGGAAAAAVGVIAGALASLPLAGSLARAALDAVAVLGLAAERAVNALHDRLIAGAARGAGRLLRRAHDGRHATYLAWSLAGVGAIVLYLVGGF